jgi:peroxiredoxin
MDETPMLTVGETAPDFELRGTLDGEKGTYRLSEFTDDGVHSHERFATQHDISFPLLSDTSKEVAETYGVVQEEYDGMRRVHRRAVFLIDDTRTIRFVAAIEAESPDDIDLNPLNEVLADLRG